MNERFVYAAKLAKVNIIVCVILKVYVSKEYMVIRMFSFPKPNFSLMTLIKCR
jgi:hypothetical protein